MSCSVCRLPFTPIKTSRDPRPPPPGILSRAQDAYFQNAYGIFRTNHGIVAKALYVDNNMFSLDNTVMVEGPFVIVHTWEDPPKLDERGGTSFYAHTACSWMFRIVFNAMGKSVRELTDLLEPEYVLGRPLAGAQAGALPNVSYERVPPGVDVGSYWSATRELGRPSFDWESYIKDGYGWTLSPPNVFPAFKPLTPERISSVVKPPAPTASFTRWFTDVLFEVLPHLGPSDYVRLTATCRYLRYAALTVLQMHAQSLLLDLGWAIPVPEEAARMHAAGLDFASPDPAWSPAWSGKAPGQRGMDWLLYLSHVHRTQSMRARRWIFDTCLAIRAAVEAARPGSAFADVCGPDGTLRKSDARARLEKEVRFVKTWDLTERGGLDAVMRSMQVSADAGPGTECNGSYASVIARGVAEMEREDEELVRKMASATSMA